MRKIKQAIILAGGKSRRFWPLTNKALIPFMGKPIIDYQHELMLSFVDTVYVVGNLELQKRWWKHQSHTRFVKQNQADGMAGALLSLPKTVKGEALIVNATDVFEPGLLTRYQKILTNRSYDLVVTGKPLDHYFPGGYWRLEGGRPVGVVEKPPSNQLPSRLVKLMVDYCADIGQLINQVKSTTSQMDDRYERALDRLLKAGKKIRLVEYAGEWLALKYPWQVLSMLAFFLKTLKRNASTVQVAIAPSAEVVGPVVFGNNVRIGSFAKIVGPCYIGNNVAIGDYALVRESQVGDNCLIGAHSELARSYLSENVMLHRCYVGDSVIGRRVMFGAGAVTANLRFDQRPVRSMVGEDNIATRLGKFGTVVGDGSQIGVNVTILPGKKIGANATVMSGTVVRRDIADDQFFRPVNL
ncbi:NTP transferase domain-containing protein [Patescibacteria group bacterium]|nr:NTP transferase domain-containing protein [Patescibacteria group bacterium]MCL5091769.1 NTP transferase domain-containing protein [Patescibacteria group bacterium]